MTKFLVKKKKFLKVFFKLVNVNKFYNVDKFVWIKTVRINTRYFTQNVKMIYRIKKFTNIIQL